jgi:hypothetical protein
MIAEKRPVNGAERFFQVQRLAFESIAIGAVDVLPFTILHWQMKLLVITDRTGEVQRYLDHALALQ